MNLLLLCSAKDGLSNKVYKSFLISDSATDFEKEDVRNELDIMMVIPRHANVVTLLGSCAKEGGPLLSLSNRATRISILT